MVLVTGGTGFLGSYIIKHLLEKGYSVRAMRRSKKFPSWIDKEVFNKVQWVDADVLDVVALQEAMEGVDSVIHSAALVSFVKKDRKEMYTVNVEGTANVVNMMLEKNIKQLVHISSVAALGRTTKGMKINEEKKWENSRVNTHYAISKFKAEQEVWRGIAEGLEAVILNPGTILGYGDWNNGSCSIFKTIYNGFRWYTPGINSYVDVEDAARVAVLMMEKKITAERFIVTSDTWPFKRIQDIISDGFGKKHPSRRANAFFLGIAWRIERIKSIFTGKNPLLTKESAKVAMSQSSFENKKILKALPGFSFTLLDETIKKACEKYKISHPA
ncbi:MAG TPA: SDR family NAD(P)-dependent oxidoreductase [Chitinophagaceae bacterium]|nr:SDR family NAD(P)-dependent oxidoreductase [Chitinophagaceae bacterium]